MQLIKLAAFHPLPPLQSAANFVAQSNESAVEVFDSIVERNQDNLIAIDVREGGSIEGFGLQASKPCV